MLYKMHSGPNLGFLEEKGGMKNELFKWIPSTENIKLRLETS